MWGQGVEVKKSGGGASVRTRDPGIKLCCVGIGQAADSGKRWWSALSGRGTDGTISGITGGEAEDTTKTG